MKWYWVLLIFVAVIGYFGIFWTLNLSDIDININMDNNTLDAIKSIDYEAINNVNSFPECSYPVSCFENIDDYLKQFENKTLTCEYAIYCGRIDALTVKGGKGK